MNKPELPQQHNRFIRTQFRLLASIPPILFGILERKLGTITDYAGTTGFVIGFSFPALLYLRSRKIAKRKHFSVQTFYSSYSSSNTSAWLLFYFGLIMVVYVVFCLIKGTEEWAGVKDSPGLEFHGHKEICWYLIDSYGRKFTIDYFIICYSIY